MGVSKRLKVASLNSHLICVLCSGYYVEATAIVECLHTFCRSCIVKYLQANNFCPICDVQIHQAKPWSSLRPDKTLQDLVYKLVPGLYQDEMKRRRQFYCRLEQDTAVAEGEEGGFLPHGARFFSQDDSISLSLEYYSEQDESEETDLKAKQTGEKPKRYLQCPAAVTVRHLKKFLRMKYGIGVDCWVDIIYNDECLPENFSLIDVAYTFAWKRTSPMRFSYRIFSKEAVRMMKNQRNLQKSRTDEGELKRSKHQPTLERQMQSEYLGNFNLNPTNSGFCKSQNSNKTKTNNNIYNSAVKTNNNSVKEKKEERFFRGFHEREDTSKEKLLHSSEDSDTSGLRIMSEKEESYNGNSEDSKESLFLEEKRRRTNTSVPNFGEETVDSFTAKKLLRNKHKWEEKKKKMEENRGDKRRKSASQAEVIEESKKRGSFPKRRKTIADEFSLKREIGKKVEVFGNEDEDFESLGDCKNEALRKVFVTKEKPESNIKRKEGDVHKKKRKKSKHHEGEVKKRKLEVIPTSPSIMSIAKDALKLKVKLTPSKPVVLSASESSDNSRNKEEEVSSVKSCTKETENDNKKSVSDKERLLHLRAVRHKSTINKSSAKDYINAPPSLTISKIDSSEHHSMKSTLVESKPSLEIMLVSPNKFNNNNNNNNNSNNNNNNNKINNINNNNSTNNSDNNNHNNNNNNINNKNNSNSSGNSSKEKRDKTSELISETKTKQLDGPGKDVRRAEVLDNFGVLDLSEKSTRTKENSSTLPAKDASETIERCKKTTHQSIMQIAQNLVNRKLSPGLPKNSLKGGFDSGTDSSATAAAMRNLKTLSDTAVNILMAAQNKTFPSEPLKRSLSSVAVPSQKTTAALNSTKPSKDCENGSELKIPVFPMSRDRIHPIPPVPNLHEIYPRGRGRSLSVARPSAPIIKPGQNQTVRQIPDPFVVLNRQCNQNAPKAASPGLKSEKEEGGGPKHNLESIPQCQNLKTKPGLAKPDDLSETASEKNSKDLNSLLTPKSVNNNIKTVQNGSESNALGMKNGEERKGVIRLNYNTNSVRKIENMAKNIESVAAGLTARAVSNAMIDAK